MANKTTGQIMRETKLFIYYYFSVLYLSSKNDILVIGQNENNVRLLLAEYSTISATKGENREGDQQENLTQNASLCTPLHLPVVAKLSRVWHTTEDNEHTV